MKKTAEERTSELGVLCDTIKNQYTYNCSPKRRGEREAGRKIYGSNGPNWRKWTD